MERKFGFSAIFLFFDKSFFIEIESVFSVQPFPISIPLI